MTLVAKQITLENIPQFALRENDIAECVAGGMTPEVAVRRSVAGSVTAYAHYIDGDLVCLWGWRWDNYREREAAVWLLSTEAADQHHVAFGRASKRILRVLTLELRVMRVLVHSRYTEAITWLNWLGFKRSRALTEHFIEMRKG